MFPRIMGYTTTIILNAPPRTQAYYDWLFTGLEILCEQGKLQVRYEGHPWDKLLRFHPRVMDAVRRISPSLMDFVTPIDYVCLTGRVEKGDKVVTFAMDVADAPFNYSMGLLETVDLYFKCQCPICFDPEGFLLNRHVRIPYHPDVFTFQHKIRAAMLGRPLGRSTNLRRNLRVLRQWEAAAANAPKDIRLFASFASDHGIAPRTARSPLPAPHNYESETALLSRWGNQVHHPNLKRERIVQMLRSMGKSDVNARIWRSTNPAVKGEMLSPAEYIQMLGCSMIIVNVSGFRRSVPFRFMDAFLTGGAVATDTLAIRWYREFEKGTEIFEIGDLGYEREEDVDWNGVKQRLQELYEWAGRFKDNARAVRNLYQKKWAPEVFASYVVEECVKRIESGT